MGFLSWLFPSDDDRMNQAEKALGHDDFGAARQRLEGLSGERAEALLARAHEGLKQVNVDLAVAFAEADDLVRAEEHIELAMQFAERGDPELRGARRALREARARGGPVAGPKAPSMQSDPFGMAGGGIPEPVAGEAGPEDQVEGDDALFSLPPDDPRVRFALLLEGYPEPLRERIVALGPDYASAVLAIEDGHPDHALDVLQPFVGQDIVARYERGRAAAAASRHGLAISELRAFIDAEGHMETAHYHTALLLAGSLAREGRPEEALSCIEETLREQRKHVGLRANRAALLEALGRGAEADDAARDVVRDARHMGMYKLMARVRMKAGRRPEAIDALENGLNSCCPSGRCGAQPFDVEAGRLLARLHLEDRVDTGRGRELLARIKRSLRAPTWFEGYLEALIARNEEDPRLQDLVRMLSAGLREEDPRTLMMAKAFGA